jgi:phosphoribosylformylglycinamidine (FGAM) synthase-like amidotransferase family enzyme
MPHPERCAEALLGNEDGRLILLSLLDSITSGRFSPKPVMVS